MLTIPRSQIESDGNTPAPRILVAGIGNAGVNLADRLALAGYGDSLDILAINTDSLSLNSSIAPRKVNIGVQTARGLGTGGDPDLAADAAEETQAELQEALAGAGIVVLCAGLGGGVGSGATPIIADVAKRSDAMVIAVLTLPFSFEGDRRSKQAADSLRDICGSADAVIVFENDRMSELTKPKSGIHETFDASDGVLAQTIGAVIRLGTSAGPLRVSLGDLASVLRQGSDPCLFGYGESDGSNRANQALERALKNPLLNRGKLLSEARAVLVHVEGPEDLRLAEVQAIMQSVVRHCEEHTSLHLSIGVNPNFGSSVGVSILAVTGAPIPHRSRPSNPSYEAPPPPVPILEELPAQDDTPEEEPPVPTPAEELFNTDQFAVPKSASGKRTPKAKQETLRLDPVARGRFEKSEPTIIEGEDLDVPTFLRQKIRLR